MRCYCGSEKEFSVCCQPYLSGNLLARNCEQLMRSRYSAYCHKDINYVYQTYHSSVLPNNTIQEIEAFANSVHFVRLDVISTEQSVHEGYVTFELIYIQDNFLCGFMERSRFVFDKGWYYVDGVLKDSTPNKISRNDLCPCNSGKKFKQCIIHVPSGSGIS